MIVIVLIGAYLIGSLPMGYFLLRIFKRQDITKFGSGRTGGTNAMRAGGVWLGIGTGLFDLLKGYVGIALAKWLLPGSAWAEALAGIVCVLGHNWSIWLFLFTGKLSAGAGTGPNIGAAMALWPWIGLISIPIVIFVVFVIGYASVASLATAFVVMLVFALRAVLLGSPWEYAIFSLVTLIFIAWALRPNIQRLMKGTERRVGIFAKSRDRETHSSSSNSSSSSS